MYGATFQRVVGTWRRMDRCCGRVGESLAKERIVRANLWAPSQLFPSVLPLVAKVIRCRAAHF